MKPWASSATPARSSAEILDDRHAADGPQQRIEGPEPPPVRPRASSQRAVASRSRRCGQALRDDLARPSSRRLVERGLPEHRLEGAQHRFAAQHQGDVRAQRREDAGQFHGDVAAAHDRHPLRPLGQLEEAIGGDAELGAGDRRQRGRPPVAMMMCGACSVRPPAATVCASPKLRARAHQLDVALGEVRRVHPVQAMHVGIALVLRAAASRAPAPRGWKP